MPIGTISPAALRTLSRAMSSVVLPECFVPLGDHLIRAAQIVEVVHVLRAEIELEGRKHVCRRQADLLGLQAVDVGVDGG